MEPISRRNFLRDLGCTAAAMGVGPAMAMALGRPAGPLNVLMIPVDDLRPQLGHASDPGSSTVSQFSHFTV